MKKVTALMFMLFVSASMALPAFAQADAGKPPEHVARWIVLAAGGSMAIAARSRESQQPLAKEWLAIPPPLAQFEQP